MLVRNDTKIIIILYHYKWIFFPEIRNDKAQKIPF